MAWEISTVRMAYSRCSLTPRQFVADGDGTHPFLDPVVGVALGLVEGAGAFGGEFRVFNLLDPLVADTREPAFERLGLRAGNGLDEAEDAFGVPALKQLSSARRVKLKAKGGTRVSGFWFGSLMAGSFLHGALMT